MSHTPGPWYQDGMGNIGPHAVAITAGKLIDGPEYQREDLIAEVYGERDSANVHLILAAPALLKAANQFLEEWERGREFVSEDTVDQFVNATRQL